MKKLLFVIVLAGFSMPAAWIVLAQTAATSSQPTPQLAAGDEADAASPVAPQLADALQPPVPASASVPATPPIPATPRRPGKAALPRAAASEVQPGHRSADRWPGLPSQYGGTVGDVYANLPQTLGPNTPGPIIPNLNVGNMAMRGQPGALIEANGRFYRMTTKPRTVLESHAEEITAEERERYEQFVENVRKLRKSESSEEDRQTARETVEKLVSDEIDRDLEQREKQLAEIEAKAKQLRDQLEKRRAAKSEMLNMNMMMIENPSAGFGLPAEWMQSLMPPSTQDRNPISNQYYVPDATLFNPPSPPPGKTKPRTFAPGKYPTPSPR